MSYEKRLEDSDLLKAPESCVQEEVGSTCTLSLSRQWMTNVHVVKSHEETTNRWLAFHVWATFVILWLCPVRINVLNSVEWTSFESPNLGMSVKTQVCFCLFYKFCDSFDSDPFVNTDAPPNSLHVVRHDTKWFIIGRSKNLPGHCLKTQSPVADWFTATVQECLQSR